jgi:hypothetical protein
MELRQYFLICWLAWYEEKFSFEDIINRAGQLCTKQRKRKGSLQEWEGEEILND